MSKRKTNIQFLTLSAIMAALYVGLDFLAVSISAPLGGSMKISISGLPVLIVAVFAGPIWGGACGFVGALVGQMISYGFTPMTLLWVLPAVVRGVSGGLLFKAFKSSTKPWLSLLILRSTVRITPVHLNLMLRFFGKFPNA